MPIWRVLVSVLVLGVTACAEAPVEELRETAIDQDIGLTPNCPPGQSVIFWTEPFGFCGQCTVRSTPGQPERQYAACSGDIHGTKRLIQNLCTTPCELL
jgi:hypothetical protein